MIERKIHTQISYALKRQAAVVIIGPRQVGKTTIAHKIGDQSNAVYLDLENPADRDKLSDSLLFFKMHEDRLVILDEIHHAPEIFQVMRGIIDEGRRKGKGIGRFLILGSASIDLLRQSSESLAGRVAYMDMYTFVLSELSDVDMNQLWLRGGFPNSLLSKTEMDSYLIRQDFIRTYLERDIPMFGPRIPTETLRRLWIMLAHLQGSTLNVSRLAQNLDVSTTTVSRYIDLLVDLFLIRRLRPYHANTGKRLVKAPKIYVRDSGILHALLNIKSTDDLFSNPIVGNSFEGFVIENIISMLPYGIDVYFYRTQAGAEIDLILNISPTERWGIEIKRGSIAKPTKGFYYAQEDLKLTQSFVVYGGEDTYPIDKNTTALSLSSMLDKIALL